MRLPALLAALAALLSACDDGTIVTRIDKRIGDLHSYIVSMAAGGLPVEVHGAPFAGVGSAEVIARLRMPGGWPTDIRFREADGTGRRGRLVLAFNPRVPNGRALCGGGAPAMDPPREVGFSVTASFCNGDSLLTTGHMEARKTRADDPQGFADVMARLLHQIL